MNISITQSFSLNILCVAALASRQLGRAVGWQCPAVDLARVAGAGDDWGRPAAGKGGPRRDEESGETQACSQAEEKEPVGRKKRVQPMKQGPSEGGEGQGRSPEYPRRTGRVLPLWLGARS